WSMVQECTTYQGRHTPLTDGVSWLCADPMRTKTASLPSEVTVSGKPLSTAIFRAFSHPTAGTFLAGRGIFKRPVDEPTWPVVNPPGLTEQGRAADDRRLSYRIGPATPHQGW